MPTKYPRQIKAIKRKTKTISVEAHFSPAASTESDPPLGFYDSNFSRFKITGIDTQQNAYPYANIPVSDVADIFANTEYAVEAHMDHVHKGAQQQSGSSEENGAAYSVRIPASGYAYMTGKSPAQVLLEYGDRALNDLRALYPSVAGDAALAAAITEAGKAYKAGALKPFMPHTPAYTVAIASGDLKGKTPAQVIAEDAARGASSLTRQREWLSRNLQKYPNNQAQIDAIDEALAIAACGGKPVTGGTAQTQTASAQITIYNAEARALIRKKRADGMCPVHNIDIKWLIGDDNPVLITITEFYAPVTERENGTISPQVSQRDPASVKTVQMRVTKAEWLDTVRAMKAVMNTFEIIYAQSSFAASDEADRISRQATGAKQLA